MREKPTEREVLAHVEAAQDTAAESAALRKRYRRRRTAQRAERINAMLERLARHAEPLRSFAGMAAWHEFPVEWDVKIRHAQEKLQYERRQLRKML